MGIIYPHKQKTPRKGGLRAYNLTKINAFSVTLRVNGDCKTLEHKMYKNNITVPVTELPISKKYTTIIVEPTAYIDGFESDSYDTAELTSVLHLDNPIEQWVQIPLPFSTEKNSASISVISAGPDEFKDRIVSVSQIRGGYDNFKPYLSSLGLPEDQIDTNKELRNILKGMRVATVKLPAGKIVLKIQCSQIIEQDKTDSTRKTFSFKAYAPLPSFLVPVAAPLKLTVIFKDSANISREFKEPILSYPHGQIPTIESSVIDFGEDKLYYWKWQNDPVVEFTYKYA